MEKKRLAFETVNEADEVVIGDRSLILRIGSNLLSNALKFTQKGAVKLITGYSDGNFILTVDDTGTGIDKEKQDGYSSHSSGSAMPPRRTALGWDSHL